MHRIHRTTRLVVAAIAALAAAGTVSADDNAAPVPTGPLTDLEVTFQARSFDLERADFTTATSSAGSADLGGDAQGFGPGIEATFRRHAVFGGLPVTLGLSGFLTGASLDDTAAIRFDGRGAFALTGLTVGGARADAVAITTNPNAATADIVLDGVSTTDSGTIANVESTVGGFSGSALETAISRGVLTAIDIARFDGTPRATSIGIVATDRAFAAAGAGDLTGVRISQAFDDDLFTFGGSARIGGPAIHHARTRLDPFIGLAYRGYRRDIGATTTIATPSIASGGSVVSQARTTRFKFKEDLDGDYYGVIGGATLEAALTRRVSLALSGTGGVSYLDASYSGTQSAAVDTGGAVSRIRGASVSDADGRAAALGRIDAGLTYATGRFEFTVNGTAEYLSDVPTVERISAARRSLTTSTAGHTDRAVSGDLGPGRPGSRLRFDDLWSFGGGISVTARF